LISLALRNAAYSSPGDSSDQAKELGNTVNKNEHLKRGDLIFWEGHVGVMLDEKSLLHANGYHMKVIEEPLEVAKERIETNNGGLITAIKRIIF
jgi:cell wall-associated NlpC family hydrolase